MVLLQEPSRSAFLCSAMIFVKYREVSTRTILPNFIGNCRDSVVFAFWQTYEQKREKEEAYIKEVYVKEAYVRQVLSCFNLILLANQNNSPGQPKGSLRIATAIRYNYHVQLVATKRGRMRVADLKFWSARQRGCRKKTC